MYAAIKRGANCRAVHQTILNDVGFELFTTAKRTTFILQRKYPVRLIKYGETEQRLKGKDYVYDLVKFTENEKDRLVNVVLKQYVEGIGLAGDVVQLPKMKAYSELLLPGLADYATPEVIEASKKNHKDSKDVVSSPFALAVAKYLENMVLSVVVNKDTPWTIKPWHIRVSFRKAGVIVPEHAIALPAKPISGPDLNLEQKDFVTVVTINGREKANVRCRIHHWSSNPSHRLPFVKNPWCLESAPIFEEQADILAKLPLVPPPKEKSIVL